MYTSKNRNPRQLYEFDIWATGEHRASHRGTTGHRRPPGATGGWGKSSNRPILFLWSGPLGGIAVSNLRPGYRSHRLNRAKCDFEVSLHSATCKMVNS